VRPTRCFLPLAAVAGLSLSCEAGQTPSSPAVQSQLGRPRDRDVAFVAGDFHGMRPGSALQLFAVGSGAPTQLTFCGSCLILEAIPSPDRLRTAVRRVTLDTNRNARFDDGDRVNLALLDLSRQIEGLLIPDTFSVQSADWSSTGGFLAHASIGPEGGMEDLYQVESNGQGNTRLLQTPTIRERGVRINPAITRIAYERIDGTGAGKSEIWTYQGAFQLARLTSGGPESADVLPGTFYRVGSDAGPAYSPDSAQVAFRRLAALGPPGGAWDIMTIAVAPGSAPRVIAGGDGRFRSNPDWGRDGIVFTETDPATGLSWVVAVDPASFARRVLQAVPPGFTTLDPRWIDR
jgi:hypothetical protein